MRLRTKVLLAAVTVAGGMYVLSTYNAQKAYSRKVKGQPQGGYQPALHPDLVTDKIGFKR